MIEVSAPGRADLLNTHQDYKGLPVVSAAVNLRLGILGAESSESRVRVISHDLRRLGRRAEDEFNLRDFNFLGGGWFGDYVRAAFKTLLESLKPRKICGVYLEIKSDIPMGSGLGSSGALLVALIGFLNILWGLRLDRGSIAEFAYRAERSLGIPCGRLDQYGSAFGGVSKIEMKPPFRVEVLPVNFNLVVVDSGIRHSTAEIHPVRQRELREGLRQLLELKLPSRLKVKLSLKIDQVDWMNLSLNELNPYLESIDRRYADRIEFTIRMNKLTLAALEAMRRKEVPRDMELNVSAVDWMEFLGMIMNLQHSLLRDLYEVSLPEIEHIREAMLNAGALGVKISGAGLGGALIALIRNKEDGERIVREALRAGASDGWILHIDEGFRVEKPSP